MGEFLAGPDIAQRHKDNVPAKSQVGITGMIAIEHGTFPLIRCNRGDKQVVANLNLHRAKFRSDFPSQKITADDVTALDYDDLALGNVGIGE